MTLYIKGSNIAVDRRLTGWQGVCWCEYSYILLWPQITFETDVTFKRNQSFSAEYISIHLPRTHTFVVLALGSRWMKWLFRSYQKCLKKRKAAIYDGEWESIEKVNGVKGKKILLSRSKHETKFFHAGFPIALHLRYIMLPSFLGNIVFSLCIQHGYDHGRTSLLMFERASHFFSRLLCVHKKWNKQKR